LDITKPQKRIYALPCYQNTKGQGMKWCLLDFLVVDNFHIKIPCLRSCLPSHYPTKPEALSGWRPWATPRDDDSVVAVCVDLSLCRALDVV
jgi:hypothetical protein